MLPRHITVALTLVLIVGSQAQAQDRYPRRCDLNCDGLLNNGDIDAFALAITYPGQYLYDYPDCDISLADTNCDGAVNNGDIDGFVAGLGGGSIPACPGDMVLVPAGEFEMGDSFGEGYSYELPVHDVYLDAYYIDTYEVTNEQYADALNWAWDQGGLIHVSGGVVLKYGGTTYGYCDTTTSSSHSRIEWDGDIFTVTPGKEDHPMANVSWYGAVAFSNWRSGMEGRTACYDLATWTCNFDADGYRLPTEAEWEKAAGWDPVLERHFRFGEHTDGCGYNCLDGHRANYWESGHPYENGAYPWTTPVGYYDGRNHGGYQTEDAQSYYGCRDMSGNVWEWCHDWYDSGYYSSSPYHNPTGPASGTYRVLRGGSWNSNPSPCRAAYRGRVDPHPRLNNYGFRCVPGTQ